MVWIEMPMMGERLESVRFLGNGKDAELVLAFAGGRLVTLPVSRSRVEVGSGIIVDVSSLDDVSICIEYAGPDLHLRSGRFGHLRYGDDHGDFLAAAQSWLAADCGAKLSWVVEAEMCLASGPPASSDVA